MASSAAHPGVPGPTTPASLPPPRRVVYLCLDGGSGPVEAQVVDHLRLIWRAKDAPPVDVLLLGRRRGGQPPSALFAPERIAALEREAGGKGRVVVRSFAAPATGLPLALALLFRLTFPWAFTRRTLIHARAKDGGVVASLFKWLCLGFPRVLFDERGDQDSERRLALKTAGVAPGSFAFRLSLAASRGIEWFCLRSADRVLYVSENLRAMVEGRFPFARRIPSQVFCCMADATKFRHDETARARWRREFGFGDDDRVLAYVGHLQPYQCYDEMIGLIERLAPRLPALKVLFVTAPRHHEEARRRLEAAMGGEREDERRDANGSKNASAKGAGKRFVVRALPHDDVPGALNAADAGLLLRHDSPVNRAASPTKFAEYLLCGLPVVLTEGIGDASRLVREKGEGFGIVLSDLTDLDAAAATLAAWLSPPPDPARRRAVAQAAARELGRQDRIPDYARLYNGREGKRP